MIFLTRTYDGYAAGTIVQFPTQLEASLVASGSASFSAGPVTPGAVTVVSTVMGRAGIAAAGTSVVITSPQITAESRVIAYLSNAAADTTALSVTRITCANGSMTLTLNAAATAAVSVDWMILNPSQGLALRN